MKTLLLAIACVQFLHLFLLTLSRIYYVFEMRVYFVRHLEGVHHRDTRNMDLNMGNV